MLHNDARYSGSVSVSNGLDFGTNFLSFNLDKSLIFWRADLSPEKLLKTFISAFCEFCKFYFLLHRLYSLNAKFCFSGCAIALFFVWLYPVGLILSLPFIVWATVVAISRLCLARHHILDVVGGVVLAFVEYLFMSVLWLSEAKASKFASIIFDTEDPWSSG